MFTEVAEVANEQYGFLTPEDARELDIDPINLDEKLPSIEALIVRAQAVKHWLEVARHCECSSAEACGLFTDPTLIPPADGIGLDVRLVHAKA